MIAYPLPARPVVRLVTGQVHPNLLSAYQLEMTVNLY
jgi:hypothetical protein